MREAEYTAALRRQLRDRIYCLKLNAAYARGVPDCYYSGSKADLWNEHKRYQTLPPTIDLTRADVTSLLQQMWLRERHKEGRQVAMIVFSPKGHLLLPGLSWQEPIPRDEYLARAHKNYKTLAEEIVDLLGALKDKPLP